MFNNTRNEVASSSFSENGDEYPYISSIQYSTDHLGINIINNNTYYFNKENTYYINVTFNKQLIVSENAKIRLLFNNNTFVEDTIESGKKGYIVVEGNSEIHYESELKVVGFEIINGYIKDEEGHELSTVINKDVLNEEGSIKVLNNKPIFTAISEKKYYTNDIASIIINANKDIIEKYCISETDECFDEFKEYENKKVEYKFSINEESIKRVCVFMMDKAKNVSSCEKVEFNYYPFPSFEFNVEGGNITNTTDININIVVGESKQLNITSYCLVVNNYECAYKNIKKEINERVSLNKEEGENILKFILKDDDENEFEYVEKVIYDNTKPELQITITNENDISNYKDILINFTDKNGFNSNNLYEYYLSTSNSILVNSTWESYTNNKMFRIRNVEDKTYYLWIRNIMDKASNAYTNENYFLISQALTFDNTKPVLTIENTSNNKIVDINNLSTSFIIRYTDLNKIRETFLDSSSLVLNSTNGIKYKKIEIENIDNGWTVTLTFSPDSIKAGYFSLTVLSNLVEDIAGNKNDEIVSELIRVE